MSETVQKGKWVPRESDGDVFWYYESTCKKCGKVLATLTEKGYWDCNPEFICDHIVPLFKGGKDWHVDPEMTNFQTLCVECNKVKTRSDVSKPKVIKQKLDLRIVQYAGFIFEQQKKVNHSLKEF